MVKLLKNNYLARCLLALAVSCHFSSLSAAGEIMIMNAHINESPPGVNVTAGYLTIQNHGTTGIMLESVESPAFGKVEIHLSTIKEGIATMTRQDSIEVPAASSVGLTPGGYHLMLFDAHERLRTGDKTSLILKFSGGVSMTIDARITRPGLDQGAMDHNQHH